MKYDEKNPIKSSIIGIFDSGIGGISVLNELCARMPYENYVYFADTNNFPYGPKDRTTLINIGKSILSKFSPLNPKAVVIACNTMSTSSISDFESSFPNLKIFGTFPNFTHIFNQGLILSNDTIFYDKNAGLKITKTQKKILIIATSSTCKSDFLQQLYRDAKDLLNIYIEPADFIASAVENDEVDTFNFRNNLEDLFKEYKDIDYLILGCTHFPFVENEIRDIIGDKTIITSNCEITAKNCYHFLINNNMLSNNLNPYIKIIDNNIDSDKEKLYKKLLNLKNIKHKIIFDKDFTD